MAKEDFVGRLKYLALEVAKLRLQAVEQLVGGDSSLDLHCYLGYLHRIGEAVDSALWAFVKDETLGVFLPPESSTPDDKTGMG